MGNSITVINSVLGFNLSMELKDADGNLVPTGIKRTCFTCSDELPIIGSRETNKKWFTHYNQELIDKIIDLRGLTA